MISIFNGNRRTLGKVPEKDIYAQISVDFRDYLHHFKGAKLAVFIAISLHADSEGIAFPSYDTLQRETGLGRDTIAKALTDLCETKVHGHRVLMKWRDRSPLGRIISGNKYKIFPSDEEVQSWEKPTVVQTLLEEEPSFKEEPSYDIVANNSPLSPHKQMEQAYLECLGYTPSAMEVVGKGIKWLIKNNYTSEQLTECYHHLKKQPYYADKEIKVQVICSQLPAYLKYQESLNTNEYKECLSALEKVNEAISRDRLGDCISNLPSHARALALRGETFDSIKSAWVKVKSAEKPVGAFMKWIKDNYLINPQPQLAPEQMGWVSGYR